MLLSAYLSDSLIILSIFPTGCNRLQLLIISWPFLFLFIFFPLLIPVELGSFGVLVKLCFTCKWTLPITFFLDHLRHHFHKNIGKYGQENSSLKWMQDIEKPFWKHECFTVNMGGHFHWGQSWIWVCEIFSVMIWMIKYTVLSLIKAEHATKLAGVVGTSKDRIRIQNDLDKLKDLKSIRWNSIKPSAKWYT